MISAIVKKIFLIAALPAILLLNPVLAAGDHVAHGQVKKHTTQSKKAVIEKKQPIKLTVKKQEKSGKNVYVEVELSRGPENSPITLDMLQEVHTKKIHLLIIDNHLSDYHHVHPQATETPGVYAFYWQPKSADAHYRIWADIVPVKDNAQTYVMADLVTSSNKNPLPEPKLSEQALVDNFTFTLSFDKPLVVGEPSVGKIVVRNAKGHVVRNLKPIMGAFAHIVAFNEDFKTIEHVHPMGKEPENDTDRGGPELKFHFMPEKAGFTRIYAQVLIGKKELYVPFGVRVALH